MKVIIKTIASDNYWPIYSRITYMLGETHYSEFQVRRIFQRYTGSQFAEMMRRKKLTPTSHDGETQFSRDEVDKLRRKLKRHYR